MAVVGQPLWLPTNRRRCGRPAILNLFESRPFTRISRKQRFPPHDPSALRLKKRQQLWCKKRRAVLPPVEFQKEPPVSFEESSADVVDKKLPVSLFPFQPFTVLAPCDSMETDAMRGNQVESFAQVWQRRLRVDSRDDAVDAEKFGRAAEERLVIGIETDSLMTE